MLWTADSVPGLTDAGAVVVVDVAAFREAVDRNLATADRLLVGGDPEVAQVPAAVEDTSPSVTVVTREALTDRLLAEPAARRVLLVAGPPDRGPGRRCSRAGDRGQRGARDVRRRPERRPRAAGSGARRAAG